MLRQLTRTARFWAASILAVGYLLCALAPAAAFVVDKSRAAHCLTEIKVAAEAGHDYQVAGDHAHDDHQKPHKHPATSDGDNDKGAAPNCCGIACVNALPASLPALGYLAVSMRAPIPLVHDVLIGAAPPLLYRPPISL